MKKEELKSLRKKLIAAGLAASTVFSAAACTNKKPEKDDVVNSTSVEEQSYNYSFAQWQMMFSFICEKYNVDANELELDYKYTQMGDYTLVRFWYPLHTGVIDMNTLEVVLEPEMYLYVTMKENESIKYNDGDYTYYIDLKDNKLVARDEEKTLTR